MAAGGRLLLVVVAFAILTALFTYPLIFHAEDTTPVGSYSLDQCKTMWFVWWTKTAVFDVGENPFWTDAIYAPYGTNVAYHICLFTSVVAAGIAQLLHVPAGSPLVYNICVFLSFVLTGVGSFLLIRHITGRAITAFAASIFVAFSPYRLWHLDHLNLLSMEWSIFAIFFTLRFVEKPRYSYLCGAILFMVVAFYASLTNVMLAAMFLLAYLLIFREWMADGARRARIIRGMAIGVVVSLVLVLPGLLSMQNAQSVWDVTWPAMEQFSSDFAYLFLPVHPSASGSVGQEYLGYLLIILAVACLWVVRTRDTRRWVLLSLILIVISLGPTLLIGGHRVLPGWLPQRWLLAVIPYFNLSRSPVRAIAFVYLALAIVSAFAFDVWLARIRDWFGRPVHHLAGVLTVVCVSGLLLWENGQGSIPLVSMTVPPVYVEVAQDPSIKMICDYPVADKLQLGNWYMYWQTIHGRSTVNGYLAHRSQAARTLLDQVASWTQVGPKEMSVLLDAGVDAIVYHTPTDESRIIYLRDAIASTPPITIK